METGTLVMELRRRAIKRWVPCGDMDRRLKIPHSAKVECRFGTTQCNAMQRNATQRNAIQYMIDIHILQHNKQVIRQCFS